MSKLIDLSSIPLPDFIEKLDFETILTRRKTQFLTYYDDDEQREIMTARLLLESEPVVKVLEESSYLELLLRTRINQGALSVSLAHATGNDLESIAANFNVTRLTIQEADEENDVAEVLESDAALRYRAQLAYDSISTAGAESGYIYHALSASGKVSDVYVESPQPAYITVSVLSHDNDGTADEELLQIVRTALSDESVRPLADRVTVQTAEIINYQIRAKIYISDGPEAEIIKATAETALQSYIKEQVRLGRDINLSAIHAALHTQGVTKVEISEPANNIVVSKHQAGYCTEYNIDTGVSDD